MKHLQNQRGFTIIESLVVLLIIAVITAAAAPIFKGHIAETRETVAEANAKTLHQVAQLYLLDGGSDTVWAPPTGELPREEISGPHEGWYPYLDKWPECPTGGSYVVEIEDGEIQVWVQGAE